VWVRPSHRSERSTQNWSVQHLSYVLYLILPFQLV
jgi:hypothetical protein